MLALDDRTGNVLTTIALFATIVAVAFAAKTTIVVFVLALLFAYILEPAVAWVQGVLRQPSSRTSAIAVVYVGGLIAMAGIGSTFAPAIAGQWQRLRAEVPGMLARLTDHRFLAEHGSQITAVAQRAGHALGVAAADAGWLLLVPVIAVFFLSHRADFIDGTVTLFAHRHDRASVTRTVGQVDSMLAQYVRAQLALAVMSSVIYSGSMALLGFPYPLALGVMGGALEFIPIAGWILGAAIILAAGWLAGAPWIWMAVVIAIWKTLEGVVVSPRMMGHRLALDPLTVLFALMAGGQIAGVLGVVLSVPAAAVLRILWLERTSGRKAAAA